jgi:hypothetical protein
LKDRFQKNITITRQARTQPQKNSKSLSIKYKEPVILKRDNKNDLFPDKNLINELKKEAAVAAIDHKYDSEKRWEKLIPLIYNLLDKRNKRSLFNSKKSS